MSRHSLHIEVAGICGRVNLEQAGLASWMESSTRRFLSEREPDFIVDVVPAPLHDISESSLRTAVDEASVNTKVVKEDEVFSVFIELDHNRGTSSPVRIGAIDGYRNICRLDDYSEDLTRGLINAFFRTCVQFFLGRSKGFLLHAGGLVRQGTGYLFAGPSGSGKSTVVGQSNGMTVLSDDLVCVRNRHDRYYACGTPWHGEDGNESAEIEKVFFLRQDDETRFERLSRGRAILETLGNITTNIFDSELETAVLDTVCEITATIPCYLMHFSLSEPWWEMIESLDGGDAR
ncbi:hypothetical protein ACFL6R_01240 [Gemmatimonadota bacterium]